MISGTFYTLTEVAEILNKDRSTIRRWIRRGVIKGEPIGNMVLIDESEIAKFKPENQHVKTN